VQQTRAGDVLRLTDDLADQWVILARGWGASPRLLVLAASGETRRLRPDQLSPALSIVGSLDLPEPIRTRDSAYGNSVAQLLRDWQPDPEGTPLAFSDGRSEDDPVASCPQLAEHLSWVRRVQRSEREITRLERRTQTSEEALVQHFRSLLQLLDEWGYVQGWSLTPKGQRLRFIYNELDLLLVESMAAGAGDGLTPADLAAYLSAFTYESRLRDEPGVAPNRAVERRVHTLDEMSADLNSDEQRLRLPETRAPDAGFSGLAHAWSAGGDLDDLFDDEVMAGDFVRNCRQLLDVLRQVRDGFPELAGVAQEAIAAVDRGVVAAGGRV
jgi:ATP-dependent RNA helicase HelY